MKIPISMLCPPLLEPLATPPFAELPPQDVGLDNVPAFAAVELWSCCAPR